MYKIADSTEDNTTIIPATESFEPVEIVAQPAAKNLLNFKTLGNTEGLAIDKNALTLTTDGSAAAYQCDWGDSASVCEKHLSHSVCIKCHVKILEDCTINQSSPFRISVHNETKNRTLSLAGINSVAVGTVYTAGQEFDWAKTTGMTTNYENGDVVKLYVYAPLGLKVEFSHVMISLENIPYEPYPDCEVIFTPEEIESEGTEIAVNNTYNDTIEATFFGKSELKFDVAERQGNTTQEVHEASANLFDINEVPDQNIVFSDTIISQGTGYTNTVLHNDSLRKIFLTDKKRYIKYHAKIVDVPEGLMFDETQSVIGFILYNKTTSSSNSG